jgi:hypothetical protein
MDFNIAGGLAAAPRIHVTTAKMKLQQLKTDAHERDPYQARIRSRNEAALASAVFLASDLQVVRLLHQRA